MMNNKKGTAVLTALIVILLLVVCALGGYYLGGVKKTDNKKEENTICEKCEEKECSCPANNSNGAMHVFTYLNDFKGYDLYAYLNNQGTLMEVIDWNNELLLIEEGDLQNASCFWDLANNKVKYEKLDNGKTYYECVNDYSENSSGEIIKLDAKTSEVSKVKLINSCMSDASPFVYIINKSNKVTEIDTREGRLEKKDMFTDLKVKDIVGFKCDGPNEGGYEKTVYKLLLTDGSTKEVTK